ncbi:hypothetical protein CTI12_AA499930 [Artemisia annua]|uniref:Uncharacterized protein n=1 Tax=Artemisia annua TaxID=35608 RepID=A0A2U1LEF0_ARTAN|nr:hypothetical protein CTI12_AA499930 [Artemisia annua]
MGKKVKHVKESISVGNIRLDEGDEYDDTRLVAETKHDQLKVFMPLKDKTEDI